MSNPIFVFEGLEAATLTASSGSTTGYPTTNLQDRRWLTQWKSGNNTAGQTLKAQFITAKVFDSCIIANHNLASVVGLDSLLVQTSPDGSTWTTKATVINYAADPLYVPLTSSTQPYVRLQFYNEVSNFNIPPEIGILFFGKRADLPLFSNRPQRGLDANVEVEESMSGLVYGSSLSADREVYTLQWGKFTQSVAAEFMRLIRRVNGRQYPFWYCDMDGNWHFVRFRENYLPLVGVGNVIFKTQEIKLAEERVGTTLSLPGGYSVTP